jgi:hypothetical protein
MMRKTLFMALALVVAASAFAQVRTPRVSPSATLSQTVGLTDITIKYSRPGVKGRTIWGGLVPYDQVWRTGANEATTISFSDDVTINGQKLAKGIYAFFTVPGKDQWTLVFNKQGEQWGAFNYDQSQDALRIQVKPEPSPEYHEWMGFDIDEMTTDTAKIELRWEKVSVPFTVNTDSTARTLRALKNAMNPDWRTPFQAASFAFDNPGSATDQELSDWLNKSLTVNENTGNLWLKARFLNRLGKKAEAKAAAEQAIAVATPAQKDLANEIRKQIATW